MKGADVTTLFTNFVYSFSKYVFGQKSVVKTFCQLCVNTVEYKKIAH